MMTYLSEHPAFRLGLFGDATKDATKEKRRKVTAKDGKAQQYGVLAKAVFEDDGKWAVAFEKTPTTFATSVETRFRR